MPTIAFFLKENGVIIPMHIQPGEVIRLADIQNMEPLPPTKEALMTLTRAQLKSLVLNLYLTMRNIDGVVKEKIVSFILSNWAMFRTRAILFGQEALAVPATYAGEPDAEMD